MKKLGKLSINPEKVIKNEELINLRGGYDPTGCCLCRDYSDNSIRGVIVGSTSGTCNTDCKKVYSFVTGYWIC